MSKYEYVDSQHDEPYNTDPVSDLWVRGLDVSTSGFYHWRSRPQSATVARRAVLTARVRHFSPHRMALTGIGGSTPMWLMMQ